MELKMGDIIAFEGNGRISRLIKFFDRAKYTHVAMYLENGLVVESDWGGVQISSLKVKYKDATWDVYRPKCSHKKKKEACDWALLHKGRGYDYKGLIGILFKGLIKYNKWDDKGKFWCSELIADAYLFADYPLTKDKNTWDTSPQDLVDSYKVRRIKK